MRKEINYLKKKYKTWKDVAGAIGCTPKTIREQLNQFNSRGYYTKRFRDLVVAAYNKEKGV